MGKTVSFCPSLWGGKDWPSASYSSSTGLLYIPAIDNMCGSLTGESKPLIEGQLWLGADIDRLDLSVPRPVPHLGELQAWDVAAGKKVWSHKFPQQLFASVLSTAGDLVFVGGTSDRYLRAFNAKTGELLWQHKINSASYNPVAFSRWRAVHCCSVRDGNASRMRFCCRVGVLPDAAGGVVGVRAGGSKPGPDSQHSKRYRKMPSFRSPPVEPCD